jgi:SH3-like domain-containing protein
MSRFPGAGIAVLTLAFAWSAVAGERGAVTNLPLPRYVSLKASEGNVRRGPSLTHKIDWVFRHRDMPLEVTAEYGHWRRVVDKDGAGGWVHYSLLSGVRTVIIEQDLLAVRVKPDEAADVYAYVEAGVVARLGKCDPVWCRISADGYKGWADKAALWGVAPDEIRE